MRLSKRTRALIQDHGPTRFARMAGIDPDSIGHVLHGRRRGIALKTANRIVSAFPELCVAEVMLGDESLTPGTTIE